MEDKHHAFCVQYLREHKDLYPTETLEKMWLLLTSRGEERLIYGEMPSLKDA